MEEGERRREHARAVERFRELAALLVEISREPFSGSHIDQTQVTTTTLIESYRLRREFLAAAAAVRDAFPDQESRLSTFQKSITERIPLTPESAGRLGVELEAIVADLGKR